jgi:acyl-coenzyme A thioesterase PaaI-like protein
VEDTTEGHRLRHRTVLRKDRDAERVCLLMVGCSSCEVGMENSSRPGTGEFDVLCEQAPRRHGAMGVIGMRVQAFQDRVDWRCYGCGRLNERGLQIKSQWEGDDVVCRWRAQPFHVGLLDRLQGGVLATAVVCHALWTATATACRNEGIEIGEPMLFAYNTMSLHLDFFEPIPVDDLITLRAHVIAIDETNATVACSVLVSERETTRARSEHHRISLI